MNCPICNTPNPPNSRFCLKCGNPLAAPTQPRQPVAPEPQRPTPPPAVSQPAPAPDFFQQPQAFDPFEAQPPQVYPNQPPVYQPAQMPQPAGAYPPAQAYAQPYGNVSSAQVSHSFLNIWGPFAGYGTRRRHLGWLMDNQAARHPDLLKRVNQRLKERQIPGVGVRWQTLTARGLIVESRPYFIIQRGLVSLGLNIGGFGRDLFISMATYIKPPISNFRAILAAVSAAIFVGGGPVLAGMLGNAVSGFSLLGDNSGAVAGLLSTLCCLGPIWGINALVFPLLLLFSAYKFLTEKDFWALLRVDPNEFNEDDLMALEKAVEQTVRSGLDDIGLNPAELRPAAVLGSEQRLI